MAVELRAATPADEDLLRRVYRSTREDELALTGWAEAEKDAFIRMQFDAQKRSYEEQCPNASFDVVVVGGVPAGRLYVDRREEGTHILDVALLPEFRGAGVGSELLRRLLNEGRPVSLYVERFNPALSWYRRLGFAVVADEGVYLRLEKPAQAS